MILQSPFEYFLDIQSKSNVWAVPCDGIVECQQGEDEDQKHCNIPEEVTFFSLFGGSFMITFCMLVVLIFTLNQ